MSKKIYNKYTPMDIDRLLNFMKEKEDIYLVVDTKQEDYDKTRFLDVYTKIVEKCKDIDENLLDKIIIQIYDYESLNKIKQIYNFKDYIFTVYKLPKLSIIKLVIYCKLNDIDTIVMPDGYIDYIVKEKHIKFIKNNNLEIYIHTINNKQRYEKLLNYGVDGIYTDFIY